MASTKNSITPFPSVTLTTKKFRWLENKAWSDDHSKYFARKRGFLPEQIFLPPFTYRSDPKNSADVATRWILNPMNDEQKLWGWAELQRFPGAFLKAYLFYDFEATDSPDLSLDALNFLISASLILSHADLLRIVPARADDKQLFQQQPALGKIATLTTVLPGSLMSPSSSSPLICRQALEVDPLEWWLTEPGAKASGELSYLVKRMARLDQEVAPKRKPSPKRRGLLSRLLTPWR